jgi:hypothetical protein
MEKYEQLLIENKITLVDRRREEMKRKALEKRNKRLRKKLLTYIRRQCFMKLKYSVLFSILMLCLLPPTDIGNKYEECDIEVYPSGLDIHCMAQFRPYIVQQDGYNELDENTFLDIDDKEKVKNLYPAESVDVEIFNQNNDLFYYEDVILAIDGIWYDSEEYRDIDLMDLDADRITLSVLRYGRLYSIPVKTYETLSGKRTLGVYVSRNQWFSGTATFIDADSNKLYGLAHYLLNGSENDGVYYEADEEDLFEVGMIYSNKDDDVFEVEGVIERSSKTGIIATLDTTYPTEEVTLPIGLTARRGKAELLNDMDGDGIVESFDIKIYGNEWSDRLSLDLIKFKIVDEDYFEIEDNIIGGMSGSPIIQDGKLIGGLAYSRSKEDEGVGTATYARDMITEELSIDQIDSVYYDDGVDWIWMIVNVSVFIFILMYVKEKIDSETIRNKRRFKHGW